MSSTAPHTSTAAGTAYFEQQREELIGEIAMSFEQVLANVNKLNRSLEAVIAVGHEFSSVEALWSQFEGVMGKDATAAAGQDAKKGEQQQQQQQPREAGQGGGGIKAEEQDEDETMAG